MDKRIIVPSLLSILLLCMCLGGEKGNDAPKVPDRASHYKETTVTQETVSMPSTTQPGKGAASTSGITSTTISSAKGCGKCSDGTACGQYHADGQKVVACICVIPWGDGNYGSCYLSRGRICSSCTDGTPCGEENANGELCSCWEKVDGGGYLSCYLPLPRCSNCSDGTPCGQENAEGFTCECGKSMGDGEYLICTPTCHMADGKFYIQKLQTDRCVKNSVA